VDRGVREVWTTTLSIKWLAILRYVFVNELMTGQVVAYTRSKDNSLTRVQVSLPLNQVSQLPNVLFFTYIIIIGSICTNCHGQPFG
jgi:hypothetical protein